MANKKDEAPQEDGDGVLPAASLEEGAGASKFIDNPDKPGPSTVAQLEVLPDEK